VFKVHLTKGQGSMARFCENTNEHSGCMKSGNLFTK